MHSSRRDFLRSVVTAGAWALLGSGSTRAQNPAGARRIDIHQHYVSPNHYALLTKKNAVSAVPGFNQWRDYTPERNLAEMDKAGIATAMLSQTAPGVWFGDVNEARRIAREMNEYAAAKIVGSYKG